jgi:hypothetical protein
MAKNLAFYDSPLKKFHNLTDAYEDPNALSDLTVVTEVFFYIKHEGGLPQFYIQLVYKAPLTFTLRIKI